MALEEFKRLVRKVGPGLVTGAADDDPSGIATYSQAGAAFGYGLLWAMLIMLPMMISVQDMCGRIGITQGKGLAGVMKDHYPRWLVMGAVGLMVVANVINLGADLGAMAAATRLLVPVRFFLLVLVFAIISLLLQMYLDYSTVARYLKWLSLCLFAYVVTAFMVPQDWGQVLKSTLIPHVEPSFQFLMILVGLLGTTISPYLFFWQPSQVVEESKQSGLVPRPSRMPKWGPLPTITQEHVKDVRIDTWVGMTLSQATAWFILVTTAGSLHAAGKTDIATAADAAQALAPLVKGFPHAGAVASAIFAVGVVGLGLLAIPTFAGPAGYALADTFGWRSGLARKPRNAPEFYAVMAVATVAGVCLDLLNISPIKALIFSAVVNGVVAVPLILIILRIGSSSLIMGEYRNGRWIKIIGWFSFAAMALAVVAMLFSLVHGT